MERHALSLVVFSLVVSLVLGCSSTPAPRTANAASTAPAVGSSDPQALDAWENEGWEEIRDDDGIVVWSKEVVGSPIVAFRGEGDIEASIVVVASILMDLEHSNEWVDRLEEARVLESHSDVEYLTYSHLGAPVLVSDRDFVNRVHITFTPPERIRFDVRGVEDPKAPVTDFVRGRIMHSRFDLEQLAPNRTHLRCEVHADPMGALPKWIVNYFQRGWAYNTITQLRLQAVKPGVPERTPNVRALLSRHGFSM